MSAHTIKMSESRPLRMLGPALTIGGLLWVIDFVLIVLFGLQSGKLPNGLGPELPNYMQFNLRLYATAVLFLNLGLLSLIQQTKGVSRKLSISAAIFVVFAVILGFLNMATLNLSTGEPFAGGFFFGFSIFTTSIATGLVGLAALRKQVLPRPLAQLLVFIGVTTIPILFGTPLPFGPDWLTDHLAFLTSGLAYLIVGVWVWSGKDRPKPGLLNVVF